VARPRAFLVAPFALAVLTRCAGTDAPKDGPASCGATLPDSASCSSSSPSYANDVAPIVETHCLECHFAGNRVSSVVLETHAQLAASKQLVETRLYRCQMPPSDGPALALDDRETLLQWIVCGAQDN